jgi:hypothetical protein
MQTPTSQTESVTKWPHVQQYSQLKKKQIFLRSKSTLGSANNHRFTSRPRLQFESPSTVPRQIGFLPLTESHRVTCEILLGRLHGTLEYRLMTVVAIDTYIPER